MNSIIKILMERDGLTKEEATKKYKQVRMEVNQAISDGYDEDVEDIMYGELGLEMDYVFDMIM